MVFNLDQLLSRVKEFDCCNSPDYNSDSWQTHTLRRERKIITLFYFHFSAGWRKDGACLLELRILKATMTIGWA